MNKEEKKVLNTIKMLSLDMINNAESGHPGIALGAAAILYTLYAKHLKVNPLDPDWLNRDRFILSCGHGSALLYATLFMAGYNLKINDLKKFRQLNSITPGHPEYRITPGVDATTGVLGQGLAMGVGVALAERYLANLLLKYSEKTKLIDYYTYVLCSDGDLMEGISAEAASFAGTQKLNKLILLYDNNKVSSDGPTSITFDEDIMERFEAYGFNIFSVKKADSIKAINKALIKAKKSVKPSLVIINTKIGQGSLLEGTNKVHSNFLLKEDLAQLRTKLNVCQTPFEVLQDTKNYLKDKINKRIKIDYEIWLNNFENLKNGQNEKLGEILKSLEKDKLQIDFESKNFKININYNEELRKSNESILNIISKKSPLFLGGSADLANSCKTNLKDSLPQSNANPLGKNIYFGVREQAMGAILNGLALGHLKVYGATFLVFSDYLKPALRLSAIMNLSVVYIFTHDSLFSLKDGITHQPTEQLAMLRTIPNMTNFRPADITELIGVWDFILNHKIPCSIILSKEKTPKILTTNSRYVAYGAYMVKREAKRLDGIIISTGTELKYALNIAEELEKENIYIRVVSMPSMELFLKQDSNYENILLPKTTKIIVIEPSSSLLWNRFATDPKYILGIDEFGSSGSKEELAEKYEFTYEKLKDKVRKILK